METKFQAERVSLEEYEAYLKLVELIDPIIPRPDLFIMMLPTSVEDLRAGLDVRIEAEPDVRRMERGITDEDLELAVRVAKSAIVKLEERGVRVLPITVNPVEFHGNRDLRYAEVYNIRGELEILHELLLTDPEEVAREAIGKLVSSSEGQVVLVHGKTMFTGKTKACNIIAQFANFVAYQPGAAQRWEEQLTHMVDRDGGRVPATTIESNKLKDILVHIDKEGITPQEKPLILVDDMMLFIGSDAVEAIEAVEELRQRGVHVVCNFIDYTFQEEPFNFALALLQHTVDNEHWHAIETATRCTYCKEEPAVGTRRYDKHGNIADYDNETYVAGSERYEPVCCQGNHVSCVNQPEGFARQSLPI
jgi:thymidine kinase